MSAVSPVNNNKKVLKQQERSKMPISLLIEVKQILKELRLILRNQNLKNKKVYLFNKKIMRRFFLVKLTNRKID